jgi:hypothetical protein
MSASLIPRSDRTAVTGDQDERCEYANDVAPHPPWHAHAHPGRRPCYCWSRGEILEYRFEESGDGLGMKPQRRWLLTHIDEWLLYDVLALRTGTKGPAARFGKVLRSVAARMADAVIAELEASGPFMPPAARG